MRVPGVLEDPDHVFNRLKGQDRLQGRRDRPSAFGRPDADAEGTASLRRSRCRGVEQTRRTTPKRIRNRRTRSIVERACSAVSTQGGDHRPHSARGRDAAKRLGVMPAQTTAASTGAKKSRFDPPAAAGPATTTKAGTDARVRSGSVVLVGSRGTKLGNRPKWASAEKPVAQLRGRGATRWASRSGFPPTRHLEEDDGDRPVPVTLTHDLHREPARR